MRKIKIRQKIYCPGNPLLSEDSLPILLKGKLSAKFPQFEFVEFDPTEDEINDTYPVFIDSVLGINKIIILTNLDNIEASPRNSVHDYDLMVELLLLKKLKKIKGFTIIGVPAPIKSGPTNENIQKIEIELEKIFYKYLNFKKWEAQLMQGS